MNCEERIDGALSLELERITSALNSPEAIREYHRNVIARETREVYTVYLSEGYPSDGFEITLKERKIEKIVFFFRQWIDSAERELKRTDFDAVARVFAYLEA